MLGIQNTINDAVFLWNSKRKKSAFLLALVSVSALSRRKYPNIKSDKDAFIKTFQDFKKGALKAEYKGEPLSIEEIFYKWIRCTLVHEAETPFDIEFIEDKEPGMMSIRAGGAPDYLLKIGSGWFSFIITSVQKSL
jgi:hypothetical protein